MSIKPENRTFILIFALVSFVFSSAALATIFWWSQVTSFRCQRNALGQGNCEIKTLYEPLDWEKVRTFPVSELKKATLESSISSSSPSRTTYYVSLTTDRGEISLPSTLYGFSENRANLANEINSFIQDPQQLNLVVKEDDSRYTTYLIGGLFLIVPNFIVGYGLAMNLEWFGRK